jgi:hypothetical protein
MAARSYSSVVAFLEHLRALRNDQSPEARKLSAPMNEALAPLSEIERTALFDNAHDSASRRHRERALLKLNRELIARGMLSS